MKKYIQHPLLSIAILAILQSSTMVTMDAPPITRHTVSSDGLTALYENTGIIHYDTHFYICNTENINPDQDLITFKQFLNSNGFQTVKCAAHQYDWSDPDWAGEDWSDHHWEQNHYKLMHGVENVEKKDMIAQAIEQFKMKIIPSSRLLGAWLNFQLYNENKRSLEELSMQLANAKHVLKSFISQHDNAIYNTENFIKKAGNLGRLFTYAKLQHVITEKNVSHVRLPGKTLRLKNVQTKEYLDAENASKMIDENLKMCLHNDFTFSIQFVSTTHRMKIFATKEKKEGRGLSKIAMDELHLLFNEAPFDIGYDNIFWDNHGNAIIIDTEYKGAQLRDRPKLGRYPVDQTIFS